MWVASVFKDKLVFLNSFSWFHLDLTVSWYITLVCRQLPFSGNSYFVLQLQVGVISVYGVPVIFFSRCVCVFFYFLYVFGEGIATFQSISVEYFVKLAWIWKVSMSFMDILSIFVFTFLLYGMLNHMIFLFLLDGVFVLSSANVSFTEKKTFHSISYSLLTFRLMSCRIICGWWFVWLIVGGWISGGSVCFKRIVVCFFGFL